MAKQSQIQEKSKSTTAPSIRPAASGAPELSLHTNIRPVLRRAYADPEALSAADHKVLQRAMGTSGLHHFLAGSRQARAERAGPTSVRPGLPLQTKLTVGPAGDRYEQEADATASQVMRRIAASSGAVHVETSGAALDTQTTVQPEVEQPEADQIVQAAPDLQRAVGLAGGPVDSGVESDIQHARGGGRPLATNVRGSMEKAFDADFSRVRVHTNSKADALNRSLSARAFTTGQDIFFKKGAYNPGSSGGQRLVAHELTHVVQQNGDAVKRRPAGKAQREGGTEVQREGETEQGSSQDKGRTLVLSSASGDGSAPGDSPAPNVKPTPFSLLRSHPSMHNPAQTIIRRQLQFDDSWEPGIFSGLSGYDKGKVQARLNRPFVRLEQIIKKLDESGSEFEKTEHKDAFAKLKKYAQQQKSKPVSYSESESVLALIRTSLKAVKALQKAPRRTTPQLPPSESSFEQTPELRMAILAVTYMTLNSWAMVAKAKQQQDLMNSDLFDIDLDEPSGGEIVEPSVPTPKELPPEVQDEQGKLILSLPNKIGTPVLEMELKDPNFDLEGESSIAVENLKLHVSEHQVIDVPVASKITFSKAEGFGAEVRFTEPVQVMESLTITKFNSWYRNHKLDIAGDVKVMLPGTEPFETSVKYATDLGLTIQARQIALKLPQIRGVDTQGILSNLEYSTKLGAFSGRGYFEAELPILGPTKASIALHQNKFQRIDLSFKKIAYPAVHPAITGSGEGFADFDKFGQLETGAFTLALQIEVPEPGEEKQIGNLTAGAKIDHGKFYADLSLDKTVKINDYIQLNKTNFKVNDGVLEGEGEFTATSRLGSKKLPFKAGDDRTLASPPPQKNERKTDRFSTKLDFGFDWDSGFWVRGEVSVPLSLSDDKMLSGYVTYYKGSLSASAEVGEAVLVPRLKFSKQLYAYEKNVMVYGIPRKMLGGAKLGLGGVYAAIGMELNFYFNLGPIKVDANGTLKNIDLLAMTADIDPLQFEEVKGGLSASLKARPYVGLGAFAVHERLLNVQGGIDLPIGGAFGVNAITHFDNVKFVDGKFEGDVDIELPVVFGLSGKLQPYLNIYALNGLIDYNPPTEAIVSVEFLKARKLYDSKMDLNTLQKATPEQLEGQVPADLDKAKEAERDEPTLAPGVDIKEKRPKHPDSIKRQPPGAETLPTRPFDLRKMIVMVGVGTQIDRLEKLVECLSKLADRFNITGSLQNVLDWLDSYGLLEPLRNNPAAIDKLIEAVGDAVDTTINMLLKLFGFEEKVSDKEGGEEGSSEKVTPFITLPGSDRRAERYSLSLGASRIKVLVPVEPGEQEGLIEKNRLEENGLMLKHEHVGHKPVFTFDDEKKLVKGELIAKLVIGEFGVVENVKLAIDSKKKIATEFADADWKPNKAKLEGATDKKIAGELSNTQVFVTRVFLFDQLHLNMKNPLSSGGEELPAEKPVETNFQKLNNEWVLMGRGLSFQGGSIQVKLVKYNKGDQGKVTATGKVIVRINALGQAEAVVEMVENEFKSLDFTLATNVMKYPNKEKAEPEKSEGSEPEGSKPAKSKDEQKDRPMLAAKVFGGFSIQNEKLKNMKIGLSGHFLHKSLNDGKPVQIAGTVDLEQRSGWMPSVKTVTANLDTKSAPVMVGLASIHKLSIEYDHKNRKLAAVGKARFTFPGEEKKEESPQNDESAKTETPVVTEKAKGSEPKKGPTTIDGVISYKEGNVLVDLKAKNAGSRYFRVDQVTVKYMASDGWDLSGKATLQNIKGFERIQTTLYYAKQRLGFRFDKDDKVEPKTVPGVGMTAALSYLEYDLSTKKFTGEGNLGIGFPLAGNAASVTAMIRIKDNQITDFGVQAAVWVQVPVTKPLMKGLVSGTIGPKEGRLTGTLKGDLALLDYEKEEGKEGNKEGSDKAPEPEGIKTGAIKFNASIDKEGISGSISQEGKIAWLGDMLMIEDLNLQLNKVPNVQETVAKLNAKGGKATSLKELSQELSTSGIVKKSEFVGGGKVIANTSGIGGGLNLHYADGQFQKSYGTIRLGADLDKNAKPGIAGTVRGSYSTKEGFALESGSLTANITSGLQAKGKIAKQPGSSFSGGLKAALDLKGSFFKDKKFTKKLYSAKVQPTWPIIPGILSIYGEAGAEMKIEYGALPFAVMGQAELSDISLKERTFEHAFVHLKKEKNVKGGKEGGVIFAKFVGAPYLGIGAAALHPGLAGVSGGVEFPISAEASLDPSLDTHLVYDKGGGLKGDFKLDMPLVLGAKVAATPYIRGTAMAGIIDLSWRRSKPFKEITLLPPTVVFHRTLDFGNLDKTPDDPEQGTPQTESQLSLGSEQLAKEQKVEGEVRPAVAPPKVAEVHGEVTDDFSQSGPFDFQGVKKQFSAGYQKTINWAREKYQNIKEIAGKLGELAGKAAGAVGSGIKSVAKTVSTAVVDVAEWVALWWGGDPEKALKEVEESEEIGEVEHIQAIRPLQQFDWFAYRQQMKSFDRSRIEMEQMMERSRRTLKMRSQMGYKPPGSVMEALTSGFRPSYTGRRLVGSKFQ